ncbi:MAG: Rnase Y domain-containing protein, partial [Bdellovibrionota bacterium]
MDITQIIIYLATGIVFGSGAIYLLFYLIRLQIINEAKEEAAELLKEAGDQAQAEEQERKERIQEIELEAWADVEDQHLSMEQKCEELEAKVSDKKILNEEKYKTLRASLMLKETELRDSSIKLSTKQNEVNKIIEAKKQSEEILKTNLTAKTQLEITEVVEQITSNLISQAQTDYSKAAEFAEQETKEFAEQKAKRILALCIDRFRKEMSTERGISASPTLEVDRSSG